MPSFGNFLHTQLILKIPVPDTSFASKTVVITGASSGLGKETAKHIVRLGASKVILACRSIAKGDRAKAEIEASQKCKPGTIEVWQLDIESSDSINTFVGRAERLSRLDVVISNAGISAQDFNITYGTERTVAVNVIGTMLLALRLISKMKETARKYATTPHLTFVGSALYDVAKYPENHGDDIFDYLSDESHVNKMDEYNLSKLLLLYAIIQLASIVDPRADDKSAASNAIVINSLDPCFCKTDLISGLSGGLKYFMKVFTFLFARTAEEGARLIVIAASAGRQTHGKYMRAGAVQDYAPFITSKEGVRKSEHIWENLGKRLEQLQPGILATFNAHTPA